MNNLWNVQKGNPWNMNAAKLKLHICLTFIALVQEYIAQSEIPQDMSSYLL